MASTNVKDPAPTLLILPPEIRNHIFALVVVEDEPIIASVTEQVVRRRSSSNKSEGRLARKTITYPTLPSVSLACRQMYEEASAAFYSKNTFIVREKGAIRSGISLWEIHMIFRPKYFMTTNIKHIIIKYYVLYKILGDARKGPHHFEIEAELRRDGRVDVRFGGVLETLCICGPEQDLEKYNDESPDVVVCAPKNHLLRYTLRFERLRSRLRYRGRDPLSCEACGKSTGKAHWETG